MNFSRNSYIYIYLSREQINVDTWNRQKQLWRELILNYMRHHRLFRLDLDEIYQMQPFYHAQIKRRLHRETCMKIIADLVMTRKYCYDRDVR